jgi:hypothetical protein
MTSHAGYSVQPENPCSVKIRGDRPAMDMMWCRKRFYPRPTFRLDIVPDTTTMSRISIIASIIMRPCCCRQFRSRRILELHSFDSSCGSVEGLVRFCLPKGLKSELRNAGCPWARTTWPSTNIQPANRFETLLIESQTCPSYKISASERLSVVNLMYKACMWQRELCYRHTSRACFS